MKKNPNDLDFTYGEQLWTEDIRVTAANLALSYYNNKNDTKFKVVVDAFDEFYGHFHGQWVHCCFSAKDDFIKRFDDEDSSIKKFFAEIQYRYPSELAVTTCKILEGETKVGCENCHSAVTHPVSRYRGGFSDNSIDASCAMSNKEDPKLTMPIVENDEDTICKSPATTTTTPQREEWITTATSHMEDCKVAPMKIVENVRDPANESSAANSHDLPKITAWADAPSWPSDVLASPPLNSDFWDKKVRFKWIRFANRALRHYNITNSTKYELEDDETIDACRFSDSSGTWIHCCFYAVNSSSKQVNVEDSSIEQSNAKDSSVKHVNAHELSIKQQFFAEGEFPNFSEPIVTTCMIIEGETQVGCKYCYSITHPAVGDRGGFRGSSRDVPRAMSNKEDRKHDMAIVKEVKASETTFCPCEPYYPATGLDYEPLATRAFDEDGYRLPREPYDPATCPDYEPTTPAFDGDKWSKNLHCKLTKIANRALSYYNITNSTKYELVEDEKISRCCFIDSSGRWIHCCFYAVDSSSKQVNVKDCSIEQSITEDSSIKHVNAEDVSIKRPFFAEIKYPDRSEPIVTACMIMEIGETQHGCANCYTVTHPAIGYLEGFHVSSPVASGAMSNKEDSKHDMTIAKPSENESPTITTDLDKEWYPA